MTDFEPIVGQIRGGTEIYDGEKWLPIISVSVEDALRAVLMFHEGGEWTADKRAEWKRITGRDEATTKALCDHMRVALAFQMAASIP